MYRRTHGKISPDKVARFLLLDERFPRSIRFCIAQVEQCLLAMKGRGPQFSDMQSMILIAQLRDKLESISVGQIVEQGMHSFIDQLQGALNSIGNAVNGDFFDVQSQQQRFIARSRQLQKMSVLMQRQE